jgi:hypothetical protein
LRDCAWLSFGVESQAGEHDTSIYHYRVRTAWISSDEEFWRGAGHCGALAIGHRKSWRIYTDLCEQARDDAFREMIAHANQLTANAVIGVRYDATELMAGITEVLCYGTAVQVEPAAPRA